MCVKQVGQCVKNLAAVCQSYDITLSEDTSASCRSSQRNARKTFNATSSFMMHMQKKKKERKYLKHILSKKLDGKSSGGALKKTKNEK